jgi:hypothetical protein
MPDNSTAVTLNNKFITDGNNGKLQQQRDQSQGTFLENA